VRELSDLYVVLNNGRRVDDHAVTNRRLRIDDGSRRDKDPRPDCNVISHDRRGCNDTWESETECRHACRNALPRGVVADTDERGSDLLAKARQVSIVTCKGDSCWRVFIIGCHVPDDIPEARRTQHRRTHFTVWPRADHDDVRHRPPPWRR
jgi:hypothetical protein